MSYIPVIKNARIDADAVTSDKIAADAVGSSEIAADAVGSSEIATDAVGLSELADGSVDTNAIVDSAVTSVKLATDSVTSAKIAADAVTSTHIAENAVGASELADGAVDTNAIQNLSVTTGKIASDAITSDKIAADAVGSSEIATDAVGSDEIAASAVGTSELANAAVTTAKIAVDAVTSTELASNAVTTIKIADDAVTAAKIDAGLDALAAATPATGDITASGQKITNLGTPTLAGDATTKAYVDQLVTTSIHYHEAVDLATTPAGGDLDLTGEETIDGTLTSSSRVLVKDQTDPAENGIYVTGAGAWTRATDMDIAAEVSGGDTVYVRSGALNGETLWTQTETVVTLGTDDILWLQTGSADTVVSISDLSDVDTAGAVDGALFRYDTGTSDWRDTTNALIDDNGQLQLSATGITGGVLLGGDAGLYRSIANFLRTDAGLTVAGQTLLVHENSALGITRRGAAGAAVRAYGALKLGDANDRYNIDTEGQIQWGDGTNAPDTNLYRSAANTLKTDDTLRVGSFVSIDAAQGALSLSGNISAIGITQSSGLPTQGAYNSRLSTDTQPRFQMAVNGLMTWGDGTTAPDTNLYRNTANSLKTDDSFDIGINSGIDTLRVGTSAGVNTGITIGDDAEVYRDASQSLRTTSNLAVGQKFYAEAGQRVKVATKSANFSVNLNTDYLLIVDSTSGIITGTLPASHSAGQTVIVKRVGANNVVIDTADADTIDGASDFTLEGNLESFQFVSDGTNWIVI